MRLDERGRLPGRAVRLDGQGTCRGRGLHLLEPDRRNARRVMHEFHSLETQPIVSRGQAGAGWQPREAGVTFQPVPDAGVPAGSRPLRLAQMRELARRFSAHMMRNETKHDLRLLPQPLYRYEIKNGTSPTFDGAVFAYVWTAGTDPEVLLVLEARGEGSERRWQYAPARFTNRLAWVEYQDREVWPSKFPQVGISMGARAKATAPTR